MGTQSNGRFFRIFCNECSQCHGILKDCSSVRDICQRWDRWCMNRDVGMLSSKTNRSVCLNHKADDVIAIYGQCDICLKTKRLKNWLNELVQCKMCKKNICASCDKMKLHKDEKCDEFQRRELEKFNAMDYDYYDSYENGHHFFYSEISDYDYRQHKYIHYHRHEFVSDGYNEQLVDCDRFLIKPVKRLQPSKNRKFVKKSTRKRMKNKSKYKAYWKRQHDKKGNIKYNKRSNRRKEISFLIKSEL